MYTRAQANTLSYIMVLYPDVERQKMDYGLIKKYMENSNPDALLG